MKPMLGQPDGVNAQHKDETHAPPVEQLIESSTLLQGKEFINIHHLGRIYRLQQTRQGKLILTK